MSNEFKIGDFVRHTEIIGEVKGIPGTVVDVIGSYCKIELSNGVKRMAPSQELYHGAGERFKTGTVVLDCPTGKRLTVVHDDNYGAVLCDDFNTLTRENYASSRLARVVGKSYTPGPKEQMMPRYDPAEDDGKSRRCVSVMVDGRVTHVSYFYPDEKDWERKMMGTLKLYTMIPNSHVSVYTDDVPF